MIVPICLNKLILSLSHQNNFIFLLVKKPIQSNIHEAVLQKEKKLNNMNHFCKKKKKLKTINKGGNIILPQRSRIIFHEQNITKRIEKKILKLFSNHFSYFYFIPRI